MSTSLASKQVPEASSGVKRGMLVAFYLLTFLTGGFFFFVGGKLGFVVDLTASVFYIAVRFLFYAISKERNNLLKN